MDKKKIIISTLIIILLTAIGGIIYFVLTKEDKNTTLTILEKQWIENNKNKIIDLSIVNDVPILNYSGEGIIFDFLNDLEKNTSLDFNKVSYNLNEEVKTDYAIKKVDRASNKDILLFQDNYVIVTKENVKFSNIRDIKKLNIGVISTDLQKVNDYLLGVNEDVTYKSFDTLEALLENYKSLDEVSINAMAIPKILYLKMIVQEKNVNIAYNITEYTQDYVLQLGNNDKLNDILKKYYKKWSNENYQASYSKHFTNNYFTFMNIDEKDKVSFRSKRYTYGFVENAPYDVIINNKLEGINNEIMAEFSKAANIEISYKKYKTLDELKNNFNQNKVDFMLNYGESTKYEMDTFETVSSFNEELVILSRLGNNTLINSLNSLVNQTVSVLKDSKIAAYLKTYNLNLKYYDNIDSMINSKDKKEIFAIDKVNYDYFVYSNPTYYKVDYKVEPNYTYNFIARDIKENKAFNNFFNFYLSFVPEQIAINSGLDSVLDVNPLPGIILTASYIIAIIVIVILTIIIVTKLNPKNKKKKVINLTKEDKLRYIDMLTSLKNRNYLNDHIEKWDQSEIYPQTIIIIDLNNVAYINDNYGHGEGDKVINEAANILIKNQIEHSDIIRTNGNEFLIYMVSYDEKQVVSYIRKLNKELKELAHGFGAAVGYSMINDAIKTVDDAVNEATLDMRNNKEELNN